MGCITGSDILVYWQVVSVIVCSVGVFRYARDKSLPSLYFPLAVQFWFTPLLYSFLFLFSAGQSISSSLSLFSFSLLPLGLGLATCRMLALVCDVWGVSDGKVDLVQSDGKLLQSFGV